ncbi:MAG: hypothetical protein ACOCQR_03815 [bacterium]
MYKLFLFSTIVLALVFSLTVSAEIANVELDNLNFLQSFEESGEVNIETNTATENDTTSVSVQTELTPNNVHSEGLQQENGWVNVLEDGSVEAYVPVAWEYDLSTNVTQTVEGVEFTRIFNAYNSSNETYIIDVALGEASQYQELIETEQKISEEMGISSQKISFVNIDGKQGEMIVSSFSMLGQNVNTVIGYYQYQDNVYKVTLSSAQDNVSLYEEIVKNMKFR